MSTNHRVAHDADLEIMQNLVYVLCCSPDLYCLSCQIISVCRINVRRDTDLRLLDTSFIYCSTRMKVSRIFIKINDFTVVSRVACINSYPDRAAVNIQCQSSWNVFESCSTSEIGNFLFFIKSFRFFF